MSILNLAGVDSGGQPASRSRHARRDIAQFTIQWAWPSTAVIVLRGELDTTNARRFTEYTVGHISRSKG
ncbi:hypothetical protein ACWDTP_22480 [Mycobacterium sp. NPDC003449]